jgi:SAM-dependent methyltransferase
MRAGSTHDSEPVGPGVCARSENLHLGHRGIPVARQVSALLPPGARVLDLGCGEGRDSVFFAERGFDVTGVDIARSGLSKAERLACARGVRVRWVSCRSHPARRPLLVLPLAGTVALYVFSKSFHEPGRSFPQVIRMIMTVPPSRSPRSHPFHIVTE